MDAVQDGIIPLFPLNVILFPQGRCKLQIFEPRYISLVSYCMKENTGFGIVPMSKSDNQDTQSEIYAMGSYVRIVDFEKLPNGLLGITVEATDRFEIDEHWIAKDGLNMAEVSWLENPDAQAIQEEHEEMVLMLQEIYPDVEKELGYAKPEFDNGQWVAARMLELLPLPMELKISAFASWDSVDIFTILGQILDGAQIQQDK